MKYCKECGYEFGDEVLATYRCPQCNIINPRFTDTKREEGEQK